MVLLAQDRQDSSRGRLRFHELAKLAMLLTRSATLVATIRICL